LFNEGGRRKKVRRTKQSASKRGKKRDIGDSILVPSGMEEKEKAEAHKAQFAKITGKRGKRARYPVSVTEMVGETFKSGKEKFWQS